MPTQLIIEAVLALAVIAWVSYRQLTWRRMDPGRIWVLPMAVFVIGVFEVSQAVPDAVSGSEIGILSIEAVVSVGTGIGMGFLARFRTRAGMQSDAGRDGAVPKHVVESRTGWFGVALWVLVIAARIGFAWYGHSIGAALVEAPGVILMVLGLNRAARASILDVRVRKLLEA